VLTLMAFNLAGPTAGFVRHFKVVHRRQLFYAFHEVELVVLHQKAQSVTVCAAAKAVVELFFTVYGEGGGFLIMKRTARMKILALLFKLYPCVDKVDDIGSSQQVIDKNA